MTSNISLTQHTAHLLHISLSTQLTPQLPYSTSPSAHNSLHSSLNTQLTHSTSPSAHNSLHSSLNTQLTHSTGLPWEEQVLQGEGQVLVLPRPPETSTCDENLIQAAVHILSLITPKVNNSYTNNLQIIPPSLQSTNN